MELSLYSFCCFNPRARAGRDAARKTDGGERKVSIHAPARGATSCSQDRLTVPPRSIHAPARGATTLPLAQSFPLVWFQSTRPRGARRRIAAPRPRAGRFQSTRPRGARQYPVAQEGQGPSFQSTRPRGARLAREGGVAKRTVVSIHAPARGATRTVRAGDHRHYGVSIHAPARGATSPTACTPCPAAVSIHAPARGATDDRVERGVGEVVSIHAPARGATRRRASPEPDKGFNPRARAGRDPPSLFFDPPPP